MTDFLVFSDLHAHNFKYGAKQVPIPGVEGFYNSRLADTIKAIQEMIEYARSNKITEVLFGGDMFHTKNVLGTEAFGLVCKTLSDATDINWTLIPGNHDYADREGFVHSLMGFNGVENIQVFSKYTECLLWENTMLYPLPYTDYKDKAKETLKTISDHALAFKKEYPDCTTLMLAHLGVQGSLVGSDYVLVSDKDIDPTDVPGVDWSFFGHYHEHQLITSNSCFVGALTQHNWGDAGGKRGFLHVTIPSPGVVKMKRIETGAPKFIVLRDGETPKIKPNDFVRYHTNTETQVSGVDLSEGVLEIIPLEQETEEQVELTSFVPAILAEEWCTIKGKPEYFNVGMELLAEASKDD